MGTFFFSRKKNESSLYKMKTLTWPQISHKRVKNNENEYLLLIIIDKNRIETIIHGYKINRYLL